MQIQFGTSSKRVNSTFIPAMSRTYNCTLKRPCTIETPVVDISDFNINYNVAYIPDFGRYYFVSNIESVSNSITRYYLTVDALASFKTNVLAQRVFVSRSQSHGSEMLVDPYATHTADNPNIYTRNFPIGGYDTTGFYVLQTAGAGTNTSIGQSVNTYLLTAAQVRKLINGVFTESTYSATGTTVAGAEKTYFNPFQYLISCKWFPLDDDLVSVGPGTVAVQFGWWNIGQNTLPARRITGEVVVSNTEFMLPSAVDWTATSPDYSRYTLMIPGIGSLEIDPAFAGMSLYVHVVVDLLTGGAKCEIRQKTGTAYVTNDDPVIASASGYWGVDVLMTQLASDATNVASNLIHSASEAVYGMDYGSALTASMTSGYGGISNQQAAGDLALSIGLLESIPFVGSTFKKARDNLLQPALSMNGAVSNYAEFKLYDNIRLTVKHYDKLEPNMEVTNGLPFNRNIVLNQLTGYTQCNNASITVAGATIKEKLAIKSYLEGGFWIE